MLAAGATGGRVMASGAGWAWLRADGMVVHVTGERGPRGPLTAIVDRVPVCEPGDLMRLDAEQARLWQTPATPRASDPEAVLSACAAVRPHMWNDPRALRLGRDPIGDVALQLRGRGPGLTPAGDDALVGFVYATIAYEHPDAAETRQAAADAALATGEPSASLLRAAAGGEVFGPAAQMLHALIRADGARLAPAVRNLTALGRTTGRAILTGIVCALEH